MLQDLAFSWRELRKNPGLAVTAILSLTLGIGATTAVFSVIYALLVNPYPYLGAERMVYLSVLNERGDNRGVGVTGDQYKILRQAKCIESLAASWGTWNLTTTGEDLPEDVPSVQLSGNAGAHFGVPALLGRSPYCCSATASGRAITTPIRGWLGAPCSSFTRITRWSE
jgi:putative ABC transport system permease protein